jgi:hypothetical protein
VVVVLVTLVSLPCIPSCCTLVDATLPFFHYTVIYLCEYAGYIIKCAISGLRCWEAIQAT